LETIKANFVIPSPLSEILRLKSGKVKAIFFFSRQPTKAVCFLTLLNVNSFLLLALFSENFSASVSFCSFQKAVLSLSFNFFDFF